MKLFLYWIAGLFLLLGVISMPVFSLFIDASKSLTCGMIAFPVCAFISISIAIFTSEKY